MLSTSVTEWKDCDGSVGEKSLFRVSFSSVNRIDEWQYIVLHLCRIKIKSYYILLGGHAKLARTSMNSQGKWSGVGAEYPLTPYLKNPSDRLWTTRCCDARGRMQIWDIRHEPNVLIISFSMHGRKWSLRAWPGHLPLPSSAISWRWMSRLWSPFNRLP